jgi:hypothetical protein
MLVAAAGGVAVLCMFSSTKTHENQYYRESNIHREG